MFYPTSSGHTSLTLSSIFPSGQVLMPHGVTAAYIFLPLHFFQNPSNPSQRTQSFSLSSLSFQPMFCENTQRRRTHFFADASLWDTRIVGPPDHDPRSDPSNKVAQAPSSRCRDLIKNKWPTWVPQSQKRKYPFFFFLTTAAPFWLLDGGPSKAHLTRVRHLYGRPAVSGLMNGPDPWSDHPVGPTSHTIPHGLGLIPVSGSS